MMKKKEIEITKKKKKIKNSSFFFSLKKKKMEKLFMKIVVCGKDFSGKSCLIQRMIDPPNFDFPNYNYIKTTFVIFFERNLSFSF